MTCSVNNNDVCFKPIFLVSSICVGSLALYLVLLVIGQTIARGLYLLPLLFCAINTGLTKPCIDPYHFPKSPSLISPRQIFFIVVFYLIVMNPYSFF